MTIFHFFARFAATIPYGMGPMASQKRSSNRRAENVAILLFFIIACARARSRSIELWKLISFQIIVSDVWCVVRCRAAVFVSTAVVIGVASLSFRVRILQFASDCTYMGMCSVVRKRRCGFLFFFRVVLFAHKLCTTRTHLNVSRSRQNNSNAELYLKHSISVW